MGCDNVVRLGRGVFYNLAGNQQYVWDGHKYVCEDDFKGKKPCLVYTFGVSDDSSFEEAMAAKGTLIH